MVVTSSPLYNAPDFEGVPDFGGTLGVKIGTFDYLDITAKDLFTLPKNAVPMFFYMDTTTEFDAGTLNDIDIGITGDAVYFADAIDVGTAGIFDITATGVVSGALGVQFDDETIVTALYVPTGDASTEGEAIVVMFYMIREEEFVAS